MKILIQNSIFLSLLSFLFLVSCSDSINELENPDLPDDEKEEVFNNPTPDKALDYILSQEYVSDKRAAIKIKPGIAVVNHQMVIEFNNAVQNPQDVIRDAFIEEYGEDIGNSIIEEFVSCMCDRDLFLINLSETVTDQVGGVEEVTPRIKAKMGGVVEITYNYITFDEYKEGDNNLNEFINGNSYLSPESVIIAVLDTGLGGLERDPYYDIQKQVAGYDKDKSCVDFATNPQTEFFSLDFVDRDLNPYDEHSHGSHVTGIIRDEINAIFERTDNRVDYKIMPIRTHNSAGLGTYFNSACAIYHAVDQGAQIINCSWGFYGLENDDIMRDAIKYAMDHEVFVVASLGNDSKDVEVFPHSPSSIKDMKYLIPVGSFNPETGMSDFSNYFSSDKTAYLAQGEDILSYVPEWYSGDNMKSGTSMSAPKISAILAYLLSVTPSTPDVLEKFNENTATLGTNREYDIETFQF